MQINPDERRWGRPHPAAICCNEIWGSLINSRSQNPNFRYPTAWKWPLPGVCYSSNIKHNNQPMQPIQLQLIPHVTSDGQAYQHLRTILTADGILSPEDLKGLHLPEGIQFNQGVVIEGKGPIWLYAYLVHECHPAAWVGCYDPRLSGAVVVQTHTKGVSVGSVVMLNLPQSVMKE